MYARDRAAIATPVGIVSVTGDDDRVLSISIGAEGSPHAGSAKAVVAAIAQLRQWFAWDRQLFDLPLTPAATPRGQALRDGMIAIPYGETQSYGALARRIASSPRAIGQACARNPFPIVIPCHRVLATNGIGHYSAGHGVSTKQWLLAHELRYRRD
ncbi:Cysteine methyltransferase [Sphingomonas sp. EC-HK361]|uniref:methylated-DNA--[protein]-cysteine S-methyltransferase n=1 Tax=Sphingomonas sp. EC-HK361 TaxID=2038397 RepID=UPI001259C987|nr:methylated-DNA--[protein]-cysteine S-methyltransferase [Sphingomonas sp. EC-HK361]VVS97728.1 Cysteine methyltransferase [Sphingomonas sp. EC-HK361]